MTSGPSQGKLVTSRNPMSKVASSSGTLVHAVLKLQSELPNAPNASRNDRLSAPAAAAVFARLLTTPPRTAGSARFFNKAPPASIYAFSFARCVTLHIASLIDSYLYQVYIECIEAATLGTRCEKGQDKEARQPFPVQSVPYSSD